MGGGIVHGWEHQPAIALTLAGLGCGAILISFYLSGLKLFWPFISAFCLIPLILFIPAKLGSYIYKIDSDYKLRHTIVSGVKDRPKVSPNGNQIGIRVSFSVIFPKKDYYSIFPVVRPSERLSRYIRNKSSELFEQYLEKNSYYSANLRILERSVTPFPKFLNSPFSEKDFEEIPTSGLIFDKDVEYKFDVTLVPLFVRGVKPSNNNSLCLANTKNTQEYGLETSYSWQAHANTFFPYEIYINDTNYGSHRGPDRVTQNNYSPSVFYEGVLNEQLSFCKSTTPTPESLSYSREETGSILLNKVCT